MSKIFYELSDPTQNVPETDDIWEANLKDEKIICASCRSFINHLPIDIYLKDKVLKSFAPITFANPTHIVMIRKDIVSLLGLTLLEDAFYIGKVYDKNKELTEEYISFVPKSGEKYIRGGEQSTCGICEQCGALLYFPLPQGKEYLVANQFPDKELFSSNFLGITVNADIYQTIKQAGIQKIGQNKLTVKEKAIDGYDDFFPLAPICPRRVNDKNNSPIK